MVKAEVEDILVGMVKSEEENDDEEEKTSQMGQR